jgi:uncharacterized membrane protein YraQ (UPF0718 family)
MKTATLILWVIAGAFLAYAWARRDGSLKKGLIIAWETTLRNALLMGLAFIIVGFVHILSPTQLVQALIGPGSGWIGLLLAAGIGMLLPGGPYVVFPIIAVLHMNGASLGAVITLITSWSTQSLLTVTFELPFMGWRFTAIRWSMGLILPILVGSLVSAVM